MKRQELTQEKLKELLNYDPDTGIFTWKERPLDSFKNLQAYRSWNTRCLNKRAGTIQKKGESRVIIIFGTIYKTGRLAWLYMNGEWPKNQIDNIDGDTLNDKIENLQEHSVSDRMYKIKSRRNINGLGFMGVSPTKSKKNPYQAAIVINRKLIYLGSFKTPEEAHEAYVTAKRQLSPEFCML